MFDIKIKYPTRIERRKIGDKLYVLEVIRDLDEAIDLICSVLSPDEKLDPFAEDLCPYFGILWPAAEGLAQFLDQNPGMVKNQRILELGSGLGLPSLVALHLGASVLTTDFHPDVEEYFSRNCRHSNLQGTFRRLNWRDEGLQEKFDVVMGSDVLYESKHPSEVAKGLLRFVKPGGKIILSDPGRAYLQKFIHAMEAEGHEETLHPMRVGEKDIFVLEFSRANEGTE